MKKYVASYKDLGFDENFVKEDKSANKKGKDNGEIPPDYEPNWADEF